MHTAGDGPFDISALEPDEIHEMVSPYIFTKAGSPAAVPAVPWDVASLVKPGAGGAELDLHDPDVKTWVSQIPGGQQALHAASYATSAGVAQVVFQKDGESQFAWTSGNQPLTAGQKKNPWWVVYPAGHAVFSPGSSPEQSAAAAALKEALEAAKAEASKSSEDIQQENALKEFVNAGSLIDGGGAPADKWSKLAVALKKSADSPATPWYAIKAWVAGDWFWSHSPPIATASSTWYEVQNGVVSGIHPAGSVPGHLAPVHNGVIKSLMAKYFSAPTGQAIRARRPASYHMGEVLVTAVPAGSKVYTIKGKTMTTATSLFVKKPDGSWVVVNKSNPGVLADASTSGYDSEVASGGIVPAVTSPAPPEPPPAPLLPPLVAAKIAEGLPVEMDDTSALVDVLPGGGQSATLAGFVAQYGYSNYYALPSPAMPGSWSSSYNGPTAAQRKLGYWHAGKVDGKVKLTYFPPPKPLAPGSPEASLYELFLHGAVMPPTTEQKKDFRHVLARTASLTARGVNDGVYYVTPAKYADGTTAWGWEKSAPLSGDSGAKRLLEGGGRGRLHPRQGRQVRAGPGRRPDRRRGRY